MTSSLARIALLAALLSAPTVAQAQYVVPGPPMYGSFSVTIGDYTPGVLQGVAGGPISLGQVDSSCRGTATIQPSHVILASGPVSMLRIAVRSGHDSTLMVLLPDGRHLCNDDSNGLDAMIETNTTPGPVYVWVGSYGGGTFPYDLTVTQAAAPPPTPSYPPLFGTVDLSGRWADPAITGGRFGGPVPASSMFSGCAGYITPQPSHVVLVPSYIANLRFVVAAPADTTMVVQYPDGHYTCNDDGGGAMNPLVEGPAMPGQLRVWVGAYSASSAGGGYQLGVTTFPGVRYDNLRGGPPPVVVAPPPVIAPPVVVAPPSSIAMRVTLTPRTPVTLFAPGITTPTVAVWSPRGGQDVEFSTSQRGSMLSIAASIGGVMTQLVEIPAALASTAVITATRRADGQVLFRAERAPEGVDPGQQMLLLVNWDRASSAPAIAQQWLGSFSERAPGWSR